MKALSRFALVCLLGLSAQSAFARVNTCVDEKGGAYSPTHSIEGCQSDELFACDTQTALTCINDKCAISNPDLAKMKYVGTASQLGGPTAGEMTAILGEALGGFMSLEEGAEARIFVDKKTKLNVACDAAPVSKADLERVERDLN